MWQLIAKPLLSVASDSIKAFAKNKAAKNELKLEQAGRAFTLTKE